MEQNNSPVFAIEKVFVKDLSVEVPNAPEVFLAAEPPEVKIDLNTKARGLGDGAFEVVLTVTVNASVGDKNYFLVEASQAGVFRILNLTDDQIEPLLAVACPNMLFPYARELVSESITRAGFAPVLLQPVNFEQLYMNSLQAQAGEQSSIQ